MRTPNLLDGVCFSLILTSLVDICSSVVVPMDTGNSETVLKSADLVFVNFYADWCRFSQMLTPIFEESSNKFTDQQNRVVFASVDCDRQSDLSQKYHINKYPTLKLFRYGQVSKREYRGQRSPEAIEEFIKQQLDPAIKDFTSNEDLEGRIEGKKRNIIGYFPAKSGPEWENIVKIASHLKDDCQFWIGSGDDFKQQTVGGPNIAFRPPNTQHEDMLFSGSLNEFDYLRQWVTDKCIPLVREITFENAEELTEEGLPFLILFRDPDDNAIVEKYTVQIAAELADQKTAVNFLYADGKKFAHPLHHLGKSEKDLPLLAIDSFRHMYVFPNTKDMEVPGKLRQFIMDLHSGKLHREFHHGPDPTEATQPSMPAIQPGPDGQPIIVPTVDQPRETRQQHEGTDPPESTFKKLKPSNTRYTILGDRDEL